MLTRDGPNVDRYVIREIIPPFLLSLLIFTFLLVLPPIMEHLENLLAKGVGLARAAPDHLDARPAGPRPDHPDGAAGRPADRPRASVGGPRVGRAPGVRSQPVPAAAAGHAARRRPATAATLYVMLVAIPDANQTFREITFDVISKRVESDIHPRVFFEDFPGWVLYARDEPDPGTPGGRTCSSPTPASRRRRRSILAAARPDGHQPGRARGRPGPDRRQPYRSLKPGEADTFRGFRAT